MNPVNVRLGNGEVLVIERPTMGERELRQLDYLIWRANGKRLERLEAEASKAVTSPAKTIVVPNNGRKDSK